MFEKKQKWRIIDAEKGIIVDEEDKGQTPIDVCFCWHCGQALKF